MEKFKRNFGRILLGKKPGAVPIFNYRSGKLYAENVLVENIVKSAGTPVYIYSKELIIKNYTAYDKAFSSQPHLICYAVKANTNFSICKTIFSSGSGADVTSGGELYRAINAGCPSEKIVFAGVGKSESEIRYAVREGILMFNIESREELELINAIAKRLKKKIPVTVRVNPGINPYTHKYITTGKVENKFGLTIQQTLDIYSQSNRYTGINLVGIHCHIGSQITSVKPFVLMVEKLVKLVNKIKNLYPDGHMQYLDIGGGLGIKYDPETRVPSPKNLAEAILPLVRKTKLKLIMEPGRYIVGTAGILVTKVLYRKAPSKQKRFIIVDAGMNDLIRPMLYEAYHEIIPVRLTKQKKVLVDVVGPICESGDYLGKNRYLPWLTSKKPINRHATELLAVKCAGAYGFSMSSEYNSRTKPAEVMVDNKNWYIIRKREKYEDLIRNETNKIC